MEYFSKWSELEAVHTIITWKVIDFVWGNIIFQFGIPKTLISDNGKWFDGGSFRDFTRNMGIWYKFFSIAHPQMNGQTEVTNRPILQGLKKCLDGAKKNWASELTSILYAFQTTPQTPTGKTLFTLAFGIKVVVPIELQIPTH